VSLLASLRTLASLGADLGRHLARRGRAAVVADDPRTADLLARAREARGAGGREEAATLYRQVLDLRRGHPGALRGLRELAVEGEEWTEALEVQQRLAGVVGAGERGEEAHWLAVILYELGRAALARGDAADALAHFRSAVRAERDFVPAAVALGDAHEALGEHREAVRAWERAAEHAPALPLLARLERYHRQEGRPSRMISLYREALERTPDDLALAVALGRVYFELEMLDEAADQFEKVEVRAPDLPAVHAYLGAVFERRNEAQAAFEEYRRALALGHAFEWPHRCEACGAPSSAWRDRCEQCRRWNTLRPARG